MQTIPLYARLAALSGVGPRRAEALAEAGFQTIEDLLWGLPYRYVDRGSIVQIGKLKYLPSPADTGYSSNVTLLGKIAALRQSTTRIKRMPLTEALLNDETGSMRIVWFNQPHLPKIFKQGDTLLVWGEFAFGRQGIEMHSPAWELVARAREGGAESDENPFAARYLPLYRRIGPLAGRERQRLIALALRQADCTDVFLPMELSKGLPGRLAALRMLHSPPDQTDLADLEAGQTPAHQRLAAEELFAFALGIEMRRAGRLSRCGETIETSVGLRNKLKSYLPFSLTTAQRKAFREIVQDLTSGKVMHRMLQGDVGSGKTLVAFLAMAMVAETGGQAALLAPTEVLARQHAASFAKLLAGKGEGLQLLAGTLKAAEKRTALERIASGAANYVVGTHSLFQEAVSFNALKLVVIDEQHRFGVKQREAIKEKGVDPHWLVMSATPIPRSLALAIFGDLDQSILDEMPPGRQTVKTRLIDPDDSEVAWKTIDKELNDGRQAFVVSPAIDTSEGEGQKKLSLRDIKEMEAFLRSRFKGVPLAIVHGRLKTEDLNGRMMEFVRGEAKILLATTVIEVGMDVPNATAMVVDHAERFGLSQLHQLRGRVGRGKHGGNFIMMSKSDTDRLLALAGTSDGFQIAQRDLEIRGPGEFFGTRQSGLPQFKVANLIRDRQLLAQCRQAAVSAMKRGLSQEQQAWLKHEQARLKLAEIS